MFTSRHMTSISPSAKGIANAIQRQFGLRADLARLDDDERAALFHLAQRASSEANPGDLSRHVTLSERDAVKLLRLVEKAADRPGHFKRHRVNAELRRKLATLAERAARPTPP